MNKEGHYKFRPVLTSLDWFISLLITSMIQYFWGGSLLLPTSVISIWHTTYTCSSSASCRAVGNPIPLLICKWFFEISSSQNLFWNLFFVYFKLDFFVCVCRVLGIYNSQRCIADIVYLQMIECIFVITVQYWFSDKLWFLDYFRMTIFQFTT